MQRLVLLLLCLCTVALPGQQPLRLRDGQSLTVHGVLTMVPGGRLQFVAVKTIEAYLPTVQGLATTPTHEVGLNHYNRYDLLYAHRGQVVTVTGTVMTDDASPYYLHNISLRASSIRLSDGTDLMGKPRTAPTIAADVGQYQASVLLPADLAAPWQYSAHGQPDPEQQFLSCSSNGGGDVVNCYCAKGFNATRAESTTKGVNGQVFSDSHTAQFAVGDDARRVELSVICSR